jgi:hypothetical protein
VTRAVLPVMRGPRRDGLLVGQAGRLRVLQRLPRGEVRRRAIATAEEWVGALRSQIEAFRGLSTSLAYDHVPA